jgi:hypothetical protein
MMCTPNPLCVSWSMAGPSVGRSGGSVPAGDSSIPRIRAAISRDQVTLDARGDGLDFEAYRQSIVDEEQLRLLPILYWVQGGLMALYAPVALIYVVFGVLFMQIPASGPSAPPLEVGWLFAGIGGFAFVTIAVFATLTILTGFWIRKRKHRVACLVIATITCLMIPYGTLIGVFTFLVLLRPSVAVLFGAVPSGIPPQPVPPTQAGSDDGGGQQAVT